MAQKKCIMNMYNNNICSQVIGRLLNANNLWGGGSKKKQRHYANIILLRCLLAQAKGEEAVLFGICCRTIKPKSNSTLRSAYNTPNVLAGGVFCSLSFFLACINIVCIFDTKMRKDAGTLKMESMQPTRRSYACKMRHG